MDMDTVQTIPQLPTELLLLILSFVKEVETLLMVYRSSRTLRALSLSFFKSIDLHSDLIHRAPSQWVKLYKSLQASQIPVIITKFHTKLWRLHSGCWRRTPCSECDGLDDIMGKLLLSMVNLESLYIDCDLCRNMGNDRHQYLDKLVVPKLQAFAFDCSSCCQDARRWQHKILALPWLSKIQSFLCRMDDVLYSQNESSFNSRILPHVRNLKFFGTQLEMQIISTRRIERLSVLVDWKLDDQICRAISRSPGKITHLILQWYSSSILEDVAKFTQIRHLGTFPGSEPDGILFLLKGCKYLEHLTSIDVDALSPSLPVRLDHDMCSQFRTVHPKLRKIMVYPVGENNGYVWELRGDRWARRFVKYFTTWDIIRGACDDL